MGWQLRVLDASNAIWASSDEQASRTNSVCLRRSMSWAPLPREIARNAADASAQATSARQGAEQGSAGCGLETVQAMRDLSSKIDHASVGIQA